MSAVNSALDEQSSEHLQPIEGKGHKYHCARSVPERDNSLDTKTSYLAVFTILPEVLLTLHHGTPTPRIYLGGNLINRGFSPSLDG